MTVAHGGWWTNCERGKEIFAPIHILSLGSADDLAQIARNLFAGLRALDEQGVDVILARDFGQEGLGLAIRDRLQRAASQVVGC